MARRTVLFLVCALIGCHPAERSTLGHATRDTLAGGAVSVMSDGPTAWADSSGWRLVEESRIVDADSGPGELAQPTGGAIDAAGRLYVVDQNPVVIKVFDRAGKLLRTIGRDGDGPGELRSPIIALRGSDLVVFDPRLQRMSVFDTSGTFLRSWRSICCNYAAISVDRAGRIAVRIPVHDRPEISGGLLRYTIEGAVADTMWIPKDGTPTNIEVTRGGNTMTMNMPYAPQQVSALDQDGFLIHGWSGAYRLVLSRNGRDTVQIFGRRWTPVPVPEDMRDSMYAGIVRSIAQGWGEEAARRAFSKGDIPGIGPAINGLSLDPTGTRWVTTFSADTVHRVLDVFDSAGVFLGQVPVPWSRRHRPFDWTSDEVVVGGERSDGVPELIRYRIDRQLRP